MKHGIIEVKVVTRLPEAPRSADLLQCGAYVRLAARREPFRRWWAGIAYVDLPRGAVRIFVFKRVRDLALGAAEMLAA